MKRGYGLQGFAGVVILGLTAEILLVGNAIQGCNLRLLLILQAGGVFFL